MVAYSLKNEDFVKRNDDTAKRNIRESTCMSGHDVAFPISTNGNKFIDDDGLQQNLKAPIVQIAFV